MVGYSKAVVPTVTDQATALQLANCTKKLALSLAELKTCAVKVTSCQKIIKTRFSDPESDRQAKFVVEVVSMLPWKQLKDSINNSVIQLATRKTKHFNHCRARPFKHVDKNLGPCPRQLARLQLNYLQLRPR